MDNLYFIRSFKFVCGCDLTDPVRFLDVSLFTLFYEFFYTLKNIAGLLLLKRFKNLFDDEFLNLIYEFVIFFDWLKFLFEFLGDIRYCFDFGV